MAEEAAAWAQVIPTFLEIDRTDALTELDQILDDNDDVYIGLPTAIWLIYRELSRQNVTVSLDGHGADELMGAYLQDGQSGAFRVRNALAAIASKSAPASRGVDLLRALMIKRQGHYFLRGGLRQVPDQFSLVGDDDVLPARLGFVEPATLSNVSRHRIADNSAELRSPVDGPRHRGADAIHGLAAGYLYDGAAGREQVIRRLHQDDRAHRPWQHRMPESIRMGRRKVGFNSPMPEWLNGPLSGWTTGLLDQNVPAFAELVDEVSAAEDRELLNVFQDLELGIGRADLAISKHEMDVGEVQLGHAIVPK